ncbi:MAG: HEAT repeat domain-containing protein [Deltaproteobacteria bacterium]|nr:HEAT repeat domain-containing protein [Deltaproteobacteria bacterium]
MTRTHTTTESRTTVYDDQSTLPSACPDSSSTNTTTAGGACVASQQVSPPLFDDHTNRAALLKQLSRFASHQTEAAQGKDDSITKRTERMKDVLKEVLKKIKRSKDAHELASGPLVPLNAQTDPSVYFKLITETPALVSDNPDLLLVMTANHPEKIGGLTEALQVYFAVKGIPLLLEGPMTGYAGGVFTDSTGTVFTEDLLRQKGDLGWRFKINPEGIFTLIIEGWEDDENVSPFERSGEFRGEYTVEQGDFIQDEYGDYSLCRGYLSSDWGQIEVGQGTRVWFHTQNEPEIPAALTVPVIEGNNIALPNGQSLKQGRVALYKDRAVYIGSEDSPAVFTSATGTQYMVKEATTFFSDGKKHAGTFIQEDTNTGVISVSKKRKVQPEVSITLPSRHPFKLVEDFHGDVNVLEGERLVYQGSASVAGVLPEIMIASSDQVISREGVEQCTDSACGTRTQEITKDRAMARLREGLRLLEGEKRFCIWDIEKHVDVRDIKNNLSFLKTYLTQEAKSGYSIPYLVGRYGAHEDIEFLVTLAETHPDPKMKEEALGGLMFCEARIPDGERNALAERLLKIAAAADESSALVSGNFKVDRARDHASHDEGTQPRQGQVSNLQNEALHRAANITRDKDTLLMLLKSPHSFIRFSAASSLKWHNTDPDVQTALLGIINKADEPEINREYAISSMPQEMQRPLLLAALGDEKAKVCDVNNLALSVATVDGYTVQGSPVFVFERSKTLSESVVEASIKDLGVLLRDESVHVREKALKIIHGLGEYHPKMTAPLLINAMGQESDWVLLNMVSQALVAISGKEGVLVDDVMDVFVQTIAGLSARFTETQTAKTLEGALATNFREMERNLESRGEITKARRARIRAMELFNHITKEDKTKIADNIKKLGGDVKSKDIPFVMVLSGAKIKPLNELINTVAEQLKKQKHMPRDPRFTDYREQSSPEELSAVEIIKVQTLLEHFSNQRAVDTLCEMMERDISDKETEYGGQINLTPEGKISFEEARTQLELGDGTYLPTFESLKETTNDFGSFHFHALSQNQKLFAGPSSTGGDLSASAHSNADGVVITPVGKNSFNVDYYTPDGKVIDVGCFTAS